MYLVESFTLTSSNLEVEVVVLTKIKSNFMRQKLFVQYRCYTQTVLYIEILSQRTYSLTLMDISNLQISDLAS